MKIQALGWANNLLSKYAGQIIGGITIAGDGAGLSSGITEDNAERITASTLGMVSGIIMFCFGNKEAKAQKMAERVVEFTEKHPKATSYVSSFLSGGYFVATGHMPENSNEMVKHTAIQTAQLADKTLSNPVADRILALPRKKPVETASALALVAGGFFVKSGIEHENAVEIVKGSLLCAALALVTFGKEHGNKLPPESSGLDKARNWATRSPVQVGSLLFKGVTISSIVDGINRKDPSMITSGLLFLTKDIMQFCYVKKNEMGDKGQSQGPAA